MANVRSNSPRPSPAANTTIGFFFYRIPEYNVAAALLKSVIIFIKVVVQAD
jgi:hypothetical protein